MHSINRYSYKRAITKINLIVLEIKYNNNLL